jgi:hypothetical protein
MEIETESRSNQMEFRIALALKVILGIGLAASLVSGGRQIVAGSAGSNFGASNSVAAPSSQP